MVRLIKTFIFFVVIAFSILNASERHIGIIVRTDFRGELSFAHRMKSACKNIDWDADIIDIENPGELAKSNYDFVINLVPGTYPHPKCKNYLVIFHPQHDFFNRKGFLKDKYRCYDGYLLTYAPSSSRKGSRDFVSGGQFPYMMWYPTVQRISYQTTDPSTLFHVCCSWGNRYKEEKFRKVLGLLDKEPYTRFYGNPKLKSLYPQSYQGAIPFDEVSLYELSAQAGISLVLHSEKHNDHGLPSGRIFEAAATSTVIICDQNSFVQDHFGDTVFYINTNDTAQSIYKQIQKHMEWIKNHKTEALEKAKKAHAIYKEKFLLEDQLLRLGEFHDRLTLEKRSPSS